MDFSMLETDQNKLEYDKIRVLLSVLANDYRAMGKEIFVGFYQTHLGFFTKTWSSVEIRILLACLEYVNPEFHFGGRVSMEKIIVLNENELYEILRGGQAALDKRVSKTPAAFVKYWLI